MPVSFGDGTCRVLLGCQPSVDCQVDDFQNWTKLDKVCGMTGHLQNQVLARSVILLVATLLVIGCGRGPSMDSLIADANKSNLQRLSNLYTFYQAKHNWIGPADEAAFRKFILELDSVTLTRMGIDSSAIDELFKSDRDGLPFNIKYGVQGSMRGVVAPIVFEQAGVDGMRMVAFTAAPAREVDDAEYDRLFKDTVGTVATSVPDTRDVVGGR